MRLIDADKFANTLKNISEASWFKKEQKEAFETIIGLLIGVDKEKYSPTAYDIDKIMEELEKSKHTRCLYEDEAEIREDAINDAIEIVMQGVR